MQVIVGVVLYNPDIERLIDNITAFAPQCQNTVIVDNHSKNLCEVKREIEKHFFNINIEWIENESNLGIATALSQIMNYSRQENYDWVLTLDQDSQIMSGLIECYVNTILIHQEDKIGMLSCLIKDRNFTDIRNEFQSDEVKQIPFCITSGAIMSVKAYFETKGYDESFFIDCVDFDICFSLTEKGYSIYRVNYVGLLHEVGKAENKKLLWKQINIYHHSPQRIYTFSRNVIWLQKKHTGKTRRLFAVKSLIKLLIKIMLFEDKKGEKLRMLRKGIKAGISPVVRDDLCNYAQRF